MPNVVLFMFFSTRNAYFRSPVPLERGISMSFKFIIHISNGSILCAMECIRRGIIYTLSQFLLQWNTSVLMFNSFVGLGRFGNFV